jgi:hypothetical protein
LEPPPEGVPPSTPWVGDFAPRHPRQWACLPFEPAGGVPSPSTPDQPSAGWMRARALPPWTGTQGALLPESPAPVISLPGTLDPPTPRLRRAGNGRACPLTRPGGVPSPSTPARGAAHDQPSAGWTHASASPLWTGAQGALLPETPASGLRARHHDDRLAGPLRRRVSAASQPRAASRRCTATPARGANRGSASISDSCVPPCPP